MWKKREARSAEFKAKVALAAITERQTVAELVQKYGVHATQVHAWKKVLKESASDLFSDGLSSGRGAAPEEREAELYEQIGRLNLKTAAVIEYCQQRGIEVLSDVELPARLKSA